MKTLTIKQPWATLIAKGYKHYEFRTWKTNYRGELLIHAGKSIDEKAMQKFSYLNLEYPTSRIIAKGYLEDCIKVDKDVRESIYKEDNIVYGNVRNFDGYAWKLSKIEIINFDKNTNGYLSLWEYTIEKE